MAAPLPQMLTANRLRDGEVVWWKSGSWVTVLTEGEVFDEPKAADAALEAAQAFVRNNQVVTPYLFDVRIVNGTVHPVKEREVIRAAGPSVRTDTGKQAGAPRSDRDV
jgi:hypothetical protein